MFSAFLAHLLADQSLALLREDLEEVVAGAWVGQILVFFHDGNVADAHLVIEVLADLDHFGRPVRVS